MIEEPAKRGAAPAITVDSATLESAATDPTGATLDAVTIARPPGSADLARARAERLGASRTLKGRTRVLPREKAAPAEGDLEGPRFDVLRTLGEGAMGEVVLVTDQDIGRAVAVKRMLPAEGTEALRRFAREVRTVGRLEHPNIVPIHDVGVDAEGLHYFVMKYVEGDTLATVLEKLVERDPAYVARFTLEARVDLFLEMLKAVHYAHAHGVVHRDIKPANVMVGPYGEVMVMDWGIAKDLRVRGADSGPPPGRDEPARPRGGAREELFATREGVLLGTPAYMSPEQARGENDAVDERSDVYSLCVVFEEMLTLRHPLAEHTRLSEMLAAIGSTSETSTFTFLFGSEYAGVPPEIRHFLRRGLHKAPQSRHRSVEEMIAELEDIRHNHVRVQCHLTFTKRLLGEAARAVNGRPYLVLSVLLVSLALMALGVTSLAARIAG